VIEKLLPYKKVLKRFIPKGLRIWLKTQIGYRLASEIGRRRGKPDKGLWGINLYGELGGASGLAEAARSTRTALKHTNIPFCGKDFTEDKCEGLLSPYMVNLIHVNPNQLPELMCRIPKEQWLHRYNIGFWLWEQEKLPEDWLRFLPLFDEVWTSSTFCADAVRRSCSLPVTVIPHIVTPICDETCDRATLGLPENIFLFLVMFDCDSVVERKNPWGVIRAFQQAFGDRRDSVGLVIKARNLNGKTRRELREASKGWRHVYLLDRDYSKEQVNSLIRAVDVYVSLHRAEGFGLVMAEAMYLGTPVIATGWSANTEFMNSNVACMVNAELVRLEKDEPPYRRGSQWAEPDEDQAAEYMRRLYEDEEYRTGIAKRAGMYIRERLGVERIAGLAAERLAEIEKREWEHRHVLPAENGPML